jgi:hypothetical protein
MSNINGVAALVFYLFANSLFCFSFFNTGGGLFNQPEELHIHHTERERKEKEKEKGRHLVG